MKTTNLFAYATITLLIVLAQACTPTPDVAPTPTNNALTGCFVTIGRNAQGVVSSRFEYNAENRLTKITTYDAQTGNPSFTNIITYNANGKIATSYGLDGNQTAPQFSDRISYDANNNAVLVETTHTVTNTVQYKLSMFYDSSNRMIKKEFYRLVAGAFTLDRTVLYTYTTDAFRPTQLEVIYVSTTAISTKYRYTYDANHNETTQKTYSPSNAATPSIEYIYTYDNKNSYYKILVELYSLSSAYAENYHNAQCNRNNIVSKIENRYDNAGVLSSSNTYNYTYTYNSRDYPIGSPSGGSNWDYICN